MIRWTAEALAHLDAIHDTIAADQLAAAARQCRFILEAVQRLDAFPLSGKPTRFRDVRQLVVPGTAYLIFYSMKQDAIFVRAIWHGARLPPEFH